jgi:hypothetical protein
MTTATNYARDIIPSVPVHSDWKDGPFVHSTQLELPTNYILTKTHCGGYCMDCPPEAYVYDSVKAFERDCLTAESAFIEKSNGTNTLRKSTYASSIPKRIIHLIRDPFDNLVGRMHLADELSTKRRANVNSRADKVFEDSASGFYEWCAYLDEKYADLEVSSTTINHAILEAFVDLPCHAEWCKYLDKSDRRICGGCTLVPKIKLTQLTP